MSEAQEQRKETTESQALWASMAPWCWNNSFDVETVSPGAMGSGMAGAWLPGGSRGEGMHAGILLSPALPMERLIRPRGTWHQKSLLKSGPGQLAQHSVGKKMKDEHGGEATGGQAEGWMGACREGQEGGEWMVGEQEWQQFGWETESLAST